MNQPATKQPEMTATNAIEALLANEETKNLPEVTVIQDALQNNIISLGTDEAFALRDSDGEIRAFKQRITLSLQEGTLTQPIKNGPCVISAQGYEVWAEAAGANVIFPDQVLVGSENQPNPHAVFDQQSGRPKIIHARAVAFRFSSKGIPQVCDWSTTFDTASYRMMDLLAKAKQLPQAFRLLPADMPLDEKDGTWGKYVFDGTMVLWINSSHDEALKWYGQILNREKKAIDFAQTFARRNALKHLSGLQKAPGPVWNLSVTCWRPTSGNIVKWDATQYVELQKRVGKLVHAQDEFQTKQIEAHTGMEHVDDDESGPAILDTEMDPEDRQAEAAVTGEDEQPQQQQPAPEYTDDDHNALQSLAVIMDDPGFKPFYEQACKQLKMNKGASHTPDDARKLLEKIQEISEA